jgi:hypothetical protein
MDWKVVLLRDAILRALDNDDIDKVKSILEESLLKTSDHWQERMLGEGKANIDDFFYDTYMGPAPSQSDIQWDLGEGDLVTFSPSGAPDGNWHAVDETGDSHEISPGTVGIVLEKTDGKFVEYNYDYQIAVGEKVFNDLSDNMFDKKS